MEVHMPPLFYLLLCLCCFAKGDNRQRFLITAPSVFHVGVRERIMIQVGDSLLGKSVSCQLQTEKRVPMSASASKTITQKGQFETVELEILANEVSNLKSTNGEPPYLNLVCEVNGEKWQTRVLVSQKSGYIFIQTNQPIYNPTQKVLFRIFTLDHTMRPKSEIIHVSVLNAEGNKIKKSQYKVPNGILAQNFNIPDVSKPGIWKITAHYKGDERNAAVREFKVQKFVLPSFGVSVQPEKGFLLVNAETFTITIQASYTYGRTIKGSFHCRFGVKEEDSDNKDDQIKFIKGLEQTGSVQKGHAEVTVKVSDLNQKLKDLTLNTLAATKAHFYIAVTVTDILSGEVQESEVFLPIVSSPYIVDLSRTRSYFIPEIPFEVVVMVRHPNGSPATDVPVKLDVSSTAEKSCIITTNKEGAAFYNFNLKETPHSISVEAMVGGFKSTKKVHLIRTSNSFLSLSVTNGVLSPGAFLDVTINVINGKPEDGQLYYMVLSRGTLRKAGSVASSHLVKINIYLTPDMIPSLRVIGYYYDTNGDIIADSVWVDVEDMCEGKLSIKLAGSQHDYEPGKTAELEVDVGPQKNAKVALLVVDKAIYSLGTQNKITAKQVFASMQSYDLGCSYGGGENTAAVFNDAGLTFISHSNTVRSKMRKGFSCESGFRRNKRNIDIQTEMARKETAFKIAELQKCCRHGFTLIPMKLTCEDRAKKVSKTNNKACVDAFRECCEFATKLRNKKRREDMRKAHGRTADVDEIEDFFDNNKDIRRYFPPSFEFREIDVKGKTIHKIYTPDSITTWEIQALSLSPSHGFCVVEPVDLHVFKHLFISLRLPYSVKCFEQLAIVVVIFNYSKLERELIVHMKQVEGLCSPGASSTSSYVRINLDPESSQTVTFPAVPMKTGEIPIIIELYDKEDYKLLDAIQKMLLVKNEGVVIRDEQTYFINLNGRSDKTFFINGLFPNNTVPETDVNLFVKLEEELFGQSTAVPLLSPSNVENLIRPPHGCAEQTMIRMSPTALSIRYLDNSNGWLDLEAGSRDKALDFIEKAYERILTFQKPDGSYGAWRDYPTSTWLTALVVKVLSLVADRQLETREQRGTTEKAISQEDIRKAVTYLIKTQSLDGSFSDSNPVIHREMQGGIGGVEQDASLTAFITIALQRSIPFLDREIDDVKNSISRATDFLLARVDDLKRSYALAITAYCLSTCLPNQPRALSALEKLKSLARKEGDCLVWRDDEKMILVNEAQPYKVPSGVALVVETTAYALLTSLALKDLQTAHDAACFLTSQENYEGGFKSTQDTIVALEALSEYAMSIPEPPMTKINAQFTIPGRSEMEKLLLENSEKKVEAELKKLVGNSINVKLSGEGKAKMKVAKAYHTLKEDIDCTDVSISVSIVGKVEYTAHVEENYNYYEDYEAEERKEEEDRPLSGIEWFDARSRQKRDTTQNIQNEIIYQVCISHAQGRNLSGMAIADITLLSGFDAVVADLDKLKDLVDAYISHYEITQGRVLLYFNDMDESETCIAFGAMQSVPIGLVQPAPATFYDYYEPDRRCSVLYSAPKRSKMVSVLCSADVCQCAERGCFTERKTLEMNITKKDRFDYACYRSIIDYAYEVIVDSVAEKSNFVLYSTTVRVVLRNLGDITVSPDSMRVFAKRKHCKSELKEKNIYLIMGNDGPTRDSDGNMQYLLDSNTWVEMKQSLSTCKASVNRLYCKEQKDFVKEYQADGCNL
ncbi:complement C4-like [Xyrauchen texanus]|uniref:complement C4-like n=1 Tax=Xyrauchen texanus TaxID=154827 RepID=UPI002241DB89|nr:complement C4-like [Xyrauchen texanus]